MLSNDYQYHYLILQKNNFQINIYKSNIDNKIKIFILY